ncbi:MAG TPA: SpoIIE family protein phosphatase [Thermoanaerobaculia bacterium]|nr:SpoIIE family protein phosphatase [Thermoanaerobaculia bacterium]
MTAAAPPAEVTIYAPVANPIRQELRRETISIGRASDCTIPIKDRYLSRKHAEIAPVNGSWILKDCGSANGTFLNGMRVDRDRQLHTGDRIRLGDTEIVFEAAEHTTDRILAIADTRAKTTIAIPVRDIDQGRYDTGDPAKLKTLSLLAAELLEDQPLDQLFGFISERVLLHTKASRAAIGLLNGDGKSFVNVEVRRQDDSDTSELRISRTVLEEVVKEKKALAFVDITGDEKLKRVHSIVAQGIRSILCAPMMIGDAVVGVLYVDYFVNRPISAEDVRLIAQIARFAAIKLETTRLREEAIQKRIMDEELKTASVIQRRLLPPAPTDVPGYTFAGMNRPCRTVSGDYYDFVVRPDGRVYFVIADVSGKGVTAGLLMAGLQASFRIFTKNDPRPAELMLQLNVTLKDNLPQSKFVTLFLGRLDTRTGVIEYANAGHVPPLWIRADAVQELSETDLVLGVVTRAQYNERTVQLVPGDSLVIFTDGLPEAEGVEQQEAASAMLKKKLAGLHDANAESIAQAIEDELLAGVDASITDDVTLVVVSRDVSPEKFEDDRLH